MRDRHQRGIAVGEFVPDGRDPILASADWGGVGNGCDRDLRRLLVHMIDEIPVFFLAVAVFVFVNVGDGSVAGEIDRIHKRVIYYGFQRVSATILDNRHNAWLNSVRRHRVLHTMNGGVFTLRPFPIFDAYFEVLDRIHMALGYISIIDFHGEVASAGVGHRQLLYNSRTMPCLCRRYSIPFEYPIKFIRIFVIDIFVHTRSDIQ